MASCIHVPLSGLAIKMTSLPDPVASTGQILLAPASKKVWSLKLSPPKIGEGVYWAPFCHDPLIYFQGTRNVATSDQRPASAISTMYCRLTKLSTSELRVSLAILTKPSSLTQKSATSLPPLAVVTVQSLQVSVPGCQKEMLVYCGWLLGFLKQHF